MHFRALLPGHNIPVHPQLRPTVFQYLRDRELYHRTVTVFQCRIRGTNTKPELLLRRGLHKRGFRFWLHDRRLPGKPDIVFPKYHAVLFVHGCFWHGHRCHLFRWPSTRAGFWREKLSRNKKVDRRSIAALRKDGWRVGIVWECALKGRTRIPFEQVVGVVRNGDEANTPRWKSAEYLMATLPTTPYSFRK